jgi:NitT/TauT family transport system substrate-binding protein
MVRFEFSRILQTLYATPTITTCEEEAEGGDSMPAAAPVLQRFIARVVGHAPRLASACLIAAASVLPPVSNAQVVLAVSPNAGSLPIFIAEDRRLFAAEGVSVRIHDCPIGKVCLQDMLDGKANVCTVADLPIVLASFTDRRFRILATLNTNRSDTKLVTRRGSGIVKLADLGGRRVGTFLGTTAQYALESALVYEGADPARVTLVGLQPGDGPTPLLNGQVDAVAVFEPYAFEFRAALGADSLVVQMDQIYTQTWNLVAAAPPVGPPEADFLALLRALDRASTVIRREPAYAKAVLRDRLKLPADLVDAIWPALTYDLTLYSSLLITLEGEARWATRLGLTDGPVPNYLHYLDTRPLRRLRPDRVTIAQ